MHRPVLATRVDGMPEAVIDGVAGLLREPSYPRGLAAAILRLLEAAEVRNGLGEGGPPAPAHDD